MKLVVDRVEGTIVVCETEEQKMIQIPLSEFESAPSDGDIVWYENQKAKKLDEETRSRKEAADDLFRKLLKK